MRGAARAPSPTAVGGARPAACAALVGDDRLLRCLRLHHTGVQPLHLRCAEERDRFLFTEWNDTAAGFVSHGIHGGTRAVEHLRLIVAELTITDVRTQVALSLFTDLDDMSELHPGSRQAQTLSIMLDEVVAWGEVLAGLRPQSLAVAATSR
jgi:hypothetical protein